jgi:hypothetical protein
MKRFRTGRAAPPWAGGQTGPMTADVEALMSRREFAQNSAQIHTEAPYAERATVETDPDEPTGPSAVVKLVYVGPGSSAECERVPASIHTEGDLPERADREPVQRQGTASTVPHTAESSRVSTPEGTAIAPKRSHHKQKRPKRKPRPIPTLKQVTLRPAAPPKQSRPKTQTEIDLSHHERRCSICRHPEREAIEEAFLQWRSVRSIDVDFEPDGGPTAIYRHARALKLFKQRNLSLRSSLEFVIEQAEHVMPTAEGLVKAIRAYTRINDQGEWIDTPTTHIVKVMPMLDPEPRNVTNSAAVYPACPDAGRDAERGNELKNVTSSVTLDVKKISNSPSGRKARGEGKVEVTIESPSGRPFLTGSAPQTEIDATT